MKSEINPFFPGLSYHGLEKSLIPSTSLCGFVTENVLQTQFAHFFSKNNECFYEKKKKPLNQVIDATEIIISFSYKKACIAIARLFFIFIY